MNEYEISLWQVLFLCALCLVLPVPSSCCTPLNKGCNPVKRNCFDHTELKGVYNPAGQRIQAKRLYKMIQCDKTCTSVRVGPGLPLFPPFVLLVALVPLLFLLVSFSLPQTPFFLSKFSTTSSCLPVYLPPSFLSPQILSV